MGIALVEENYFLRKSPTNLIFARQIQLIGRKVTFFCSPLRWQDLRGNFKQ